MCVSGLFSLSLLAAEGLGLRPLPLVDDTVLLAFGLLAWRGRGFVVRYTMIFLNLIWWFLCTIPLSLCQMAADMWALGVVLYSLLVGSKPWSKAALHDRGFKFYFQVRMSLCLFGGGMGRGGMCGGVGESCSLAVMCCCWLCPFSSELG